jgi:hypothetical protein
MDSEKTDFSPECVEMIRIRFWRFENKLATCGLALAIKNLHPSRSTTIEGEGCPAH